MKNKLKFIIPVVIAVIAIIVAALCIDFEPAERVNIPSIMSTAQKYLVEQNYEQAIVEFKKIIDLDPMNVDAYTGIADAYIGMGDTEKAIEWLEKGYEITGDERLKNMLDELSPENSVTEATTVTSITETEVTTVESKPTELQISYADNWYSVFNYDKDGNILKMSLYNKEGKKRLSADYAYTDNGVERTVYVDNNLYETKNVEFRDVMADVEKQKKERANTTEERNNNWYVYDENGELIEHGWHHLDADGNPADDSGEENYYKNGKIYKVHFYDYSSGLNHNTYYDEKGYPLKTEGNGYGNGHDNITYTYEYDEYGYPIIQYANGVKQEEYKNFYKDNNFIYSIRHYKDDNHSISNNYELSENGQYVRFINHTYLDYDNDSYDLFMTYVAYFVPSFDETKMIDSIWIDCSNIKPLFECPYCND